MALAGGGGFLLGLSSHRTAEEMATELTVSQNLNQAISKEVNRTLLELWKMEDVEALRNNGRMR